jgi:hypothetical protein
MGNRRKAAVAAIGLLATVSALLIFVSWRIDPCPLRAGATADEAWIYIHTASPITEFPKQKPVLCRRCRWFAYSRSIECEARFYWKAHQLLATRKTIYTVNTNSLITSVNSQWEYTWPFPAQQKARLQQVTRRVILGSPSEMRVITIETNNAYFGGYHQLGSLP